MSGSLYYFLMEFVDGVNLRRLLDTGKLAPEEALAIVPQICDALQYAHDHGVVHRDIKPENVLLDKEGRVKIADFGIWRSWWAARPEGPVRLTAAGQIMGTPQYMAPEQIEHPLQVDHRADIYSLGVVFYQMLTGELPIGRFAPPSKKVQIDVRLDEVVLRALEKEPDRRYQQASEIKTQVETIAATPPRGDAKAAAVPLANHSHFGVPLVGIYDGQKVINWPGVCMFIAVMVIGGPLAVVVSFDRSASPSALCARTANGPLAAGNDLRRLSHPGPICYVGRKHRHADRENRHGTGRPHRKAPAFGPPRATRAPANGRPSGGNVGRRRATAVGQRTRQSPSHRPADRGNSQFVGSSRDLGYSGQGSRREKHGFRGCSHCRSRHCHDWRSASSRCVQDAAAESVRPGCRRHHPGNDRLAGQSDWFTHRRLGTGCAESGGSAGGILAKERVR